MNATQQNQRGPFSVDYGDLRFHEENAVHRVRRRTVRWVLLVILALVLAAAGCPRRRTWRRRPTLWVLLPATVPCLLLMWGVFEFLSLMTAWRHVDWSVDVYEHGVVESRFGTVRQAMPVPAASSIRAGFCSPPRDPTSARGHRTMYGVQRAREEQGQQ